MKSSKELLIGIIQQFTSALRNATLYPDGHPSLSTPLRLLHSALTDLFQDRDKIALGLIDDVLILDEVPFYEANLRYAAIFSTLEKRQIEAITFSRGLEPGELQTLVDFLLELGVYTHSSIGDISQQDVMPHISLREATEDNEDPHARARATYQESLTVMIDLMTDVRLGQIPSAAHASAVIGDMRDLILQDASALLGLTQLKSYDNYTYNHSINVAIFSLAFAHHLELPDAMVKRVGLAGLLHDLGKVRMAESIIKKPGALSQDEMDKMKLHPELGAEIVQAMSGIDHETHDIVLHHHIRFDGTGYPCLPAGTEAHPQSAIVSLADCYDALTTTRPYQKSRHPSEATRILRRLSGKAYAPDLLANYVTMLGTYPVGETVRLSTNEFAVVTDLNQIDATSPKVRIISNADGQFLDHFVDCDLAEEHTRCIVASVDPLVKGIDVGRVLTSQATLTDENRPA